ncbi:MAG: helix-turn-helix domain-containing protein, partial [Actinobacteria bacterium]|nr:helix-turn-helix domain-containing protein [Actinomycetota bacterium]
LGLWLVRMVHVAGRTDPAPLLDHTDATALRTEMLDQPIPAVIRTRPPLRDAADPLRPRRGWDPDDVRRWLSLLTCQVGGTRDLLWWHLPRHTLNPSSFGLGWTAVIDRRAIADARHALGRQLAELRKAAGYTQHKLAPCTLYARSTLANVEIGRQHVPPHGATAYLDRCILTTWSVVIGIPRSPSPTHWPLLLVLACGSIRSTRATAGVCWCARSVVTICRCGPHRAFPRTSRGGCTVSLSGTDTRRIDECPRVHADPRSRAYCGGVGRVVRSGV